MPRPPRTDWKRVARLVLLTATAAALPMATLYGQTQKSSSRDRLLKQAGRLHHAGRREEARTLLADWLEKNGESADAPEVYAEQGQMLAADAAELLVQSDDAKGKRHTALQQQARELIKQARDADKRATQMFETRYKTFPRFIDKELNPKQFQARDRVLEAIILAQIDAAWCTYHEAYTYDNDDKQHRELLVQAAGEFKTLYTSHRRAIAGVYARVLQGRCLADAGEITQALGIFDEVLAHSGRMDALVQLQDRARHQRLRSLQHETRRDYELVVKEATDWLDGASDSRRKASSGVGIRWQRACAAYALFRQPDRPEKSRKRFARMSLEDARLVARSRGRYQRAAAELVQRLGGGE